MRAVVSLVLVRAYPRSRVDTMSQQLWGGLITAFGGLLLTAHGFGWFTLARHGLLGDGWRAGMKIIGPLMLIGGVPRILFSAPP